MALRTGKLPPPVLKRLLRNAGAKDRRVLVGPAVGVDAAVVQLGTKQLVLKSDPVTYASDLIGWYAVNVNANDVAAMGATPAWFQAVILLPPGSREALAESIFKQISDAAKKLGVAVTGGHTEVTPGIDRPIVIGDMHGVLETGRPVLASGAKAGDLVVLTKGAGIEGTATLAREKRRELLRVFDKKLVDRAAKFLFDPGLSIVPEAELALHYGVHAMHDPTEGGVRMGVWELAEASGHSVELDVDRVRVHIETSRICKRYSIDPLGLLGSGALLAAFLPSDAKRFVRALEKKSIEADIVGRILRGRGRSIEKSLGKVTSLSFSERDEILRVLES